MSVCIASLVTLSVYGYRFGEGNHSVYLLDAIRIADPATLARDWFTTQTLQYHIAFTWLTAAFMKLGIIAPAFAVLYVALVAIFHLAWRGIVQSQGGTDSTYLASVVLYYLSACGTGLGMYQFFQDSALLPSNIANVSLLVGIWLWLIGRPIGAGACLGVAGAFHLNHALIGALLWGMASARSLVRRPAWPILLATSLAILPGALNIVLALPGKLARSSAMPLDQFVDLYVRFRHPHHYDPSTWPAGIWIAFGWTALACVLWTTGPLRRIVASLFVLLAIALLGAGVWYVSETLVQMSLFRFSIYVQLVGCTVAATQLHRPGKRLLPLAVTCCLGMICVGAIRGPYFGLFRIDPPDADYRALCQWARSHTPVDAVILVPPNEESMRLVGRRAIVVNFKAVPQLSAELAEWNCRLCDVLDLPSVNPLAGDYASTLAALRKRYDSLTAAQLAASARRYHADFVVTSGPVPDMPARLIYAAANGAYALYDLRQND